MSPALFMPSLPLSKHHFIYCAFSTDVCESAKKYFSAFEKAYETFFRRLV